MKRSNTQLSTQTARSYGSKRSRPSIKSRKSFGSYGVAKYTGFGFPEKIQIKHRYVENIGFNAAAGALSVQQFRANGMYDPNVTGTGHQPLYFDQLSAIYDHFTVLKSYIKVTASTSSTTPQIVNIFLNDDSTITPASVESRMEQSSGKSMLISQGSGTSSVYLAFDAKKVFGGSVLGNDNLQGTGSADPTEQSLFTITCQAQDTGVATLVYTICEIVYVAVWDEVRDIAGS